VTGKINLSPVVAVGGAPLTKEEYEELRTLRIDRSMGLVGRATLRFADPGYIRSKAATFKIGTKLKVSQFPSTELFSGTVVGVNLEQMRGEPPYLVVVADDDGYKLNRGTTTKTYLQTSYTSAVQQVVAKAGLKPKITSSPGVKEYVLQAGTDIEFIDTVAARLGYSWWIDEGSFHFAPAGKGTGTAKVVMNDDLEEFSVRASGLRPTEVKVGGWHPDNQQKVVGMIQKGKMWTTPSDFVKPWVNDANKLGKASTATIVPSPVDQSEAKVAAQALFDESLAARDEGGGERLVEEGLGRHLRLALVDR